MTPSPRASALSRRIAALAAAPHLLVCADYDGTLAPLAARPEAARLLPGARDLLAALASLPATRVAVVSGRALHDLRAHSGFDAPVLLVGSHGAEGPGAPAGPSDDARHARLDDLARVLAPLVAAAPGAWLERKPFGIAVHVRAAERDAAARVLHAVRQGPARAPDLTVTEGKEVIELALSPTDKGAAVRRLRDAWGTAPRVCYLGDDTTDEAAFAVLGPEDAGVKVGPGPSMAAYRVASEAEALRVLTLLHALRAAVPAASAGP